MSTRARRAISAVPELRPTNTYAQLPGADACRPCVHGTDGPLRSLAGASCPEYTSTASPASVGAALALIDADTLGLFQQLPQAQLVRLPALGLLEDRAACVHSQRG